MLGGELAFQSQPDQGVEVVIIAPMKVQDHLISAEPRIIE
jgi:hypothetical protein